MQMNLCDCRINPGLIEDMSVFKFAFVCGVPGLKSKLE